MAKGSSMKASPGKQVGGGTRWPKVAFSLRSSSSPKVNGGPGRLKLPGTLPYSGTKGGK